MSFKFDPKQVAELLKKAIDEMTIAEAQALVKAEPKAKDDKENSQEYGTKAAQPKWDKDNKKDNDRGDIAEKEAAKMVIQKDEMSAHPGHYHAAKKAWMAKCGMIKDEPTPAPTAPPGGSSDMSAWSKVAAPASTQNSNWSSSSTENAQRASNGAMGKALDKAAPVASAPKMPAPTMAAPAAPAAAPAKTMAPPKGSMINVKGPIHSESINKLKDAGYGVTMKDEANPDQKLDAQLGEDVEHIVEDHMIANKDTEKKEGHPIVQKSHYEMAKDEWHQKGVHGAISYARHGGRSEMGLKAASAANIKPNMHTPPGLKEGHATRAKDEARRVLGEIKDQPKPNLPKSEMAKAEYLGKPYTSKAQERWAHTENGKKALGGEAKVHEWDEASKGKKLPERHNVKKEELGFDKLKNKLEHEKHPPKDAAAVAAKIGMEKYGKKGFEAKAAAGHKKSELEKSKMEEGKWDSTKRAIRSERHEAAPKNRDPLTENAVNRLHTVKNPEHAKKGHQDVIQKLKSQPKPALPKSEMAKGDLIDMKSKKNFGEHANSSKELEEHQALKIKSNLKGKKPMKAKKEEPKKVSEK